MELSAERVGLIQQAPHHINNIDHQDDQDGKNPSPARQPPRLCFSVLTNPAGTENEKDIAPT
jgi:hypothetical protein